MQMWGLKDSTLEEPWVQGYPKWTIVRGFLRKAVFTWISCLYGLFS